MILLIAVVAVVWLASASMAVAAFVLALLNPHRRFRRVLVLASLALVGGYLGFGRFTPFSFFPQIAYTWSSGDVQISLSSTWFFLVPLILAAAALTIASWNRRRRKSDL